MRKLFILTLAILLVTVGFASATNIPKIVDPKNYPTVWTEQVYNGSGSSITSGYIVEWDHATSEGYENWYDDMCPYVQTADSAGDLWTAGVVPYGNNIADGSTGAIIIRGPAYVLENTTTPPAINNICGTADDGTVTTDAASADTSSLGITILVDVANTGAGDAPDQGSGWNIIFVDPVQEAD